jgi:predicted ATPase with chaperone activity
MLEFDATAPKRIARADVERGFSHLVLSQQVLDKLGPAVNSGQSLFVYGPPGNGKTVISQAIRNLLPGDIWIPHALEVDGSIIQVFDPINHDAFARRRRVKRSKPQTSTTAAGSAAAGRS